MLWNTAYQKKNASILRKKRITHITELVAALALRGSSTTHDLAKYVLGIEEPGTEHQVVKYPQVKARAGIYFNLLRDRPKKNSDEKYPGLLSLGYVRQVGQNVNIKTITVPHYFLTLKGCLFALGYDFSDDELKEFIKNASKNYLYFAYINSILQKTSLEFVKEIFIKPIGDIIKKGRIFLDDDITFYFSNIAEVHGQALYDKYNHVVESDYDKIVVSVQAEIKRTIRKKIDERLLSQLERDMVTERYTEYASNNPEPRDENIEALIDNTFYYENPKIDWLNSLIQRFYPQDNDAEFYLKYQDEFEVRLLYLTMSSIHHAYYSVIALGFPKTPRKQLPRSKDWKRHSRFKKKFPYPPNKVIMSLKELDEYREKLK